MSNKSTKDFLEVVNEILLFLFQRLSDGVGADDILAIWTKITNDAEFRSILADAVSGFSGIEGEMKTLTMPDMMDLVATQIQYIPKFIEAIKKK